MPTKKIEPNEIELAVAAHIFMDGFTSVQHRLSALLEKIKNELNNHALTTRDIKQAIADWLVEGYALIKNGCLEITRAGRKHIASLAEVATAPAPLTA